MGKSSLGALVGKNMEQIFNELSADGCYPSLPEARRGMGQLVGLMQKMVQLGFSRCLRTTQNFCALKLSMNYTIGCWLKDGRVDKDIQRFLLLYSTKAPYIEDFLDKEQTNRIIEFKFQNRVAYGLGLAFLWDTVALSLDADPNFCKDSVMLDSLFLSEGGESRKPISVGNLALTEQFEVRKEKLFGILSREVSNGSNLLEHFSELFPKLSLSKRAEKSLKELSGKELFFKDILCHFFILNETAQNWKAGSFEPQGLNWSAETSATLQKFGKQREIDCSDGKRRCFSLHSKLMNANKRIYFFPEAGIVHIGYVGDHLPTVNFP